MSPQLLVSVRNIDEAIVAANAGVEIIDIKNPEMGSLGKADSKTINDCIKVLRNEHPHVQISAAFGELADNMNRNLEQVNSGLYYFKIGLSGMRSHSKWIAEWKAYRKEVLLESVSPKADCIAVAYVDEIQADSPTVDEVIEAAAETNCKGVLFDTFVKDSKRFRDWMDDQQLAKALQRIHKFGMFCSVAGKLTAEDVSHLSNFPVDIIAVRSAVCELGDRRSQISHQRIKSLQAQLISPSASHSL